MEVGGRSIVNIECYAVFVCVRVFSHGHGHTHRISGLLDNIGLVWWSEKY